MAASFETGERIAGDLAHTFPVFLLAWKRISRETMRAELSQGRTHLHEASKQLSKAEYKEALEHVHQYFNLCKDLETLRSAGDQLSGKLSSLKGHQIFRKYGVYRLIIRWKDRAHHHQHVVWSESDRALLNLMNVLQPSAQAAHAVPDDAPAPAGPLNSPSQLTMVGGDLEIFASEDDRDDDDDDGDSSVVSVEFHVPPGTLDSDSVFRNHWGHSE